VRLTEGSRLNRDQFQEALAGLGVSSGIYYPRLMHEYDCYRDLPQVVIDDTPAASRVTSEVLSLPVHQLLTSDDLNRVIDHIRGVLA
jgi:dTDP-4-amino-4,6-dideoxygalactose transaminase